MILILGIVLLLVVVVLVSGISSTAETTALALVHNSYNQYKVKNNWPNLLKLDDIIDDKEKITFTLTLASKTKLDNNINFIKDLNKTIVEKTKFKNIYVVFK